MRGVKVGVLPILTRGGGLQFRGRRIKKWSGKEWLTFVSLSDLYPWTARRPSPELEGKKG